MNEYAELPDDALIMGRIEIVRYLSKTPGQVVVARTLDGQGHELPIIEALGMLRLAEGMIVNDYLTVEEDE